MKNGISVVERNVLKHKSLFMDTFISLYSIFYALCYSPNCGATKESKMS